MVKTHPNLTKHICAVEMSVIFSWCRTKHLTHLHATQILRLASKSLLSKR